VRDGRTVFVPKNWEKTYFEWMENIQPWCISRQLFWGHQIPAWYGPDGKVFVAGSEDEALAEALAFYTVNETITSDEAQAIAADPSRRVQFLTRDKDVLDTWFSSALCRSRPWAGRTTRRNCSATTRPTSSSPGSTSSSSGLPA